MSDEDRRWLRIAARLALRGHGGAEPNPMVGCVLVDPSGRLVGEGLHRRCGGPHAEVEALRRAGVFARGATAFVTLEPCAHHGRTPPCADALADAGVARVVYATADPNPVARGGVARLRERGIAVEHVPTPECDLLNEPFLHRVATGRPWVVAKWAQTVDGRLATRSGDSRWISGPRSRRLVHRERGRVDAILTGVGTVLADDPQLVARDGRRRRTALRVVVDPELALPLDRRVFDTGDAPTVVAALPERLGSTAAERLAARGVGVLPLGADGSLAPLLDRLGSMQVATLLVEAGGGLLGRLFAEDLVDEALVFIAPLIAGDDRAVAIRGALPASVADLHRWRLLGIHRRGDDALLRLRR
jgi:diaminohydroxyphosphoribosylaminopyrimidine deaminase/5-amino-6-(5-phosphoribosylamino)uracil reductase